MTIDEYLLSFPKYHNLIEDITNPSLKNIYLESVSANIAKMLAFWSYDHFTDNVIYVCADTFEAYSAYNKLVNLLGEDNISFYPVEEFVSSELVASSTGFRLSRMQTLFNICENNKRLIITSPEGILRITMSKARLAEATIHLKVGDVLPIQTLVHSLVTRGYKKQSTCENVGTFSVRGSLVDIYPINSDNVYRINYFDDEIETIKIVDINTQRSVEKVNECYIYPLFSIYYDESEIPAIKEKILKDHMMVDKVQRDLEKLDNYEALDQLAIYIPYIDENYTTLINLANPSVVFYDNITRILDHETLSLNEITQYYQSVNFSFTKTAILNFHDLFEESKKNIFMSSNNTVLNDVKLDKLIKVQTINNYDYNNNIKHLIEDIKLNKNKTYIITHFDDIKVEFIKDVLTQNNLSFNFEKVVPGQINVYTSSNQLGFIDLDLNLEIITPNEFASGKIKKKTKLSKYYKDTTKVYSKEDLHVGDYVIHQNYGIGIYQGIATKERDGKLIDYIYILYDENTKLYVPVENLYLIEKYNCTSDQNPKLSNIHSNEWSKKKEKIKTKVIDVAKKLIKIQAERELLQGFVYNKDTKDQELFESEFGYTETADQLKAIEDVKKDMESPHPVDRLICGDVGFGKTEVALRAAFKAVDSGKQVAYLAPTTVLTRQHYYTFKERFEHFGARVELLNRFVPAKQQKAIIEGINSGYVDIVIGTHRLLSNEIKFKDLGLLIIDEEQRFGVTHKEKIKEIKSNVDVLTLTATPIPRTLQMSLSGLRDLSLIETPPQNRFPIQTYVLESNDSVIREAINREIGRGGQVFYLINRIDELGIVERKINRLCPEARVGKIHGQMDKEEIEEQLVNFLDNIYDVLVCTTIIETGIDIPNANTLIIEKADYLGLSQLYQIRGRVGRSDRIAYAYLMYDKAKVLNDEARKRLEAIKEFTTLGSGYKIAMRDLSIRGAGDILGNEQSGFIDAVGLELYTKMLEEAIDELKGTVKPKEDSKHFDFGINKHIEDSYIPDDEIRLEMHKEINRISSRDELNQKIAEYTDRFGNLSEDILLYMESKYLEFLMKSKGVQSIKEKDNEVVLYFDEDSTRRLKFEGLAPVVKEIAPKFEFGIVNKMFHIYIKPSDYQKSYIYTLTKFLEILTFKDEKVSK